MKGSALSHVHAALADYLANREQIDAELEAEAAVLGRLDAEWQHGHDGAALPLQGSRLTSSVNV